jgi:hypothetical protein
MDTTTNSRRNHNLGLLVLALASCGGESGGIGSVDPILGGTAATLSADPSSCTIESGRGTCPVTITWSITGAEQPKIFNSTRATQPASVASGTKRIWLTEGPNRLEARDGATVLRTIVLTGRCIAGTAWNGVSCEGSASPTCPLAPAERGRVKWNPGHYYFVAKAIHMDAALTEIADQERIRGILRRYEWNTIEPTKDGYDFSRIRTDLAKAKARGLKLWIMVSAKYSSPPEYLAEYGSY